MEIISQKIALSYLKSNYMHYFETVIKADVDIEQHIISIDAELHADLESLLLEKGSVQENIWGINLYPFNKREDFVEYTSLINIRPSLNNFSMEIEDENIKLKIDKVISELIDFES